MNRLGIIPQRSLGVGRRKWRKSRSWDSRTMKHFLALKINELDKNINKGKS
jgi:hypothetical protein